MHRARRRRAAGERAPALERRGDSAQRVASRAITARVAAAVARPSRGEDRDSRAQRAQSGRAAICRGANDPACSRQVLLELQRDLLRGRQADTAPDECRLGRGAQGARAGRRPPAASTRARRGALDRGRRPRTFDAAAATSEQASRRARTRLVVGDAVLRPRSARCHRASPAAASGDDTSLTRPTTRAPAASAWWRARSRRSSRRLRVARRTSAWPARRTLRDQDLGDQCIGGQGGGHPSSKEVRSMVAP